MDVACSQGAAAALTWTWALVVALQMLLQLTWIWFLVMVLQTPLMDDVALPMLQKVLESHD